MLFDRFPGALGVPRAHTNANPHRPPVCHHRSVHCSTPASLNPSTLPALHQSTPPPGHPSAPPPPPSTSNPEPIPTDPTPPQRSHPTTQPPTSHRQQDHKLPSALRMSNLSMPPVFAGSELWFQRFANLHRHDRAASDFSGIAYCRRSCADWAWGSARSNMQDV